MFYSRSLYLFMGLLAVVSAGCVGDDRSSSQRLAGACQVQRCVCAPGGWSPASAGSGVPVHWESDGTAYCPEGLELHLAQPPRRQ